MSEILITMEDWERLYPAVLQDRCIVEPEMLRKLRDCLSTQGLVKFGVLYERNRLAAQSDPAATPQNEEVENLIQAHGEVCEIIRRLQTLPPLKGAAQPERHEALRQLKGVREVLRVNLMELVWRDWCERTQFRKEAGSDDPR